MRRRSTQVGTWLDNQVIARASTGWSRWSTAVPSMLSGVLTCCLLTLLFFLIADEIVEDRRLRYDFQLAHWIRSFDHSGLTRAMRLVTNSASTTISIMWWLLICGWLVTQRRRRAAAIIAVVWPLGQGLVALIKVIYHRGRPELGPGEMLFSGYSFPSGHTFSAVVTYGLLTALITERLSGRTRWIPWACTAIIIVGVSFSRIYLGAHYPIDVLGSLILGGAWLRAMLLALSHLTPPALRDTQSRSSRFHVGLTEWS